MKYRTKHDKKQNVVNEMKNLKQSNMRKKCCTLSFIIEILVFK